jgi:hypothetical protein
MSREEIRAVYAQGEGAVMALVEGLLEQGKRKKILAKMWYRNSFIFVNFSPRKTAANKIVRITSDEPIRAALLTVVICTPNIPTIWVSAGSKIPAKPC